jgi:hypothetical protein
VHARPNLDSIPGRCGTEEPFHAVSLHGAARRADARAQLRTYLEQLGNIDAGNVRLDEFIRSLWQLKGSEDGVQ